MFLKVSASPHIRAQQDSASIMRSVCLSLLPVLVMSAFIFGVDALLVVMVTTLSAVFFEWFFNFISGREQTIQDWSACVTGLILGLNLPATFPAWMCIVGSFFAIVVVKWAFGGLGKNVVNPAIAARVFLLISFPSQMTNFAIRHNILGVDVVSGATPATIPSVVFPEVDLDTFATPLALMRTGEKLPPIDHLLFGFKIGVIGEVSIIALLIGAAYLLYKKIIDLRIPLSFIASTMLFVWATGGDPVGHLLTGGLIFGAFFMATDYVTNPTTQSGKILFGIGCGLITGLIRMYGAANEGVSYAILFMNVLVPHIDSLTNRFPKKKSARLELKEGGKNA